MSATHVRWLIFTAVLLLVITLLIVGLIASGVFDPSPFGQSLWHEDLSKMAVEPLSRQVSWIESETPQLPFTVRLTAAYGSGEYDSAYGLVLGDEESFFSVAVSPLGYLAIWETTSSDAYYLNWQTWPHVQKDHGTNEIWLDIEGDRAQVRINREWLWEGNIEVQGRHIGILGESFGEEVIIEFESLKLFAAAGE
jgi:hypothetical protein